MNTVNAEFFYVEDWFTDKASKALEIEDKNDYQVYIIKMRYSTEPKYKKYVK